MQTKMLITINMQNHNRMYVKKNPKKITQIKNKVDRPKARNSQEVS